ncbi:MAG: SDR family oxidoreductase [Candidatus Nanopelagicales bacterium]
MGKLDEAVIVVSGGSRGIGAQISRTLAAEGARVVIGDVLDTDGSALAEQIGGLFVHLDVTDPDDWSALIDRATSTFGTITGLVNNAGVVGFTPVGATTLEEWNRIISINLTGVFLGMEAVVPALKDAGGGVIVNISSTAGLQGYSNLAAYVASKWGVRGLTKAAALDLGPDGIRVVSIHPGGIRTPMTAGLDEKAYSRQPIARIGEPEEIAKLALFLIADATYSTGTEFIADGGATVGQVLRV